MIEYVRLRNVQGHAAKEVAFAPGVTVLVGDTNAGKSTIVRALRLLMLNEGSNGLVRHGHDTLSVKARVDGVRVGRKRGRQNVYFHRGRKLRAFGRSVPRDLEELFAVDPANFQRQFDLHFWFSDTPGAVSRQLNQIVDLAVIDESLQAAGAAVKHAKAVLDVTAHRHHAARIARNELRWVSDMLAEWRAVEEAGAAAEEAGREATDLGRQTAEAGRHANTILTLTYAARAGKELVSAGEALVAKDRELAALRELVRAGRREETLVNADLPDIGPLLLYRKKADGLAESVRTLEHLVEDAHTHEEELCRAEKELRRLSKKLKSAVCPTCGRKMKLSSPPSATCTSPSHPRLFDPLRGTGSG